MSLKTLTIFITGLATGMTVAICMVIFIIGRS